MSKSLFQVIYGLVYMYHIENRIDRVSIQCTQISNVQILLYMPNISRGNDKTIIAKISFVSENN